MDLGKRFKRYRERRGLTQNQAAELIGVKNYQLGNYETNRSEPSISTLKRMSEVYEVSIDILVGNFTNKEILNDTSETDIRDYAEQLEQISKELQRISKEK